MTHMSWHRSLHPCRSTLNQPHPLVQLSHGTQDAVRAPGARAGENEAVLDRIAERILPSLIRRL